MSVPVAPSLVVAHVRPRPGPIDARVLFHRAPVVVTDACMLREAARRVPLAGIVTRSDVIAAQGGSSHV